jgi:hypothetical protein
LRSLCRDICHKHGKQRAITPQRGALGQAAHCHTDGLHPAPCPAKCHPSTSGNPSLSNGPVFLGLVGKSLHVMGLHVLLFLAGY